MLLSRVKCVISNNKPLQCTNSSELENTNLSPTGDRGLFSIYHPCQQKPEVRSGPLRMNYAAPPPFQRRTRVSIPNVNTVADLAPKSHKELRGVIHFVGEVGPIDMTCDS